MTNADWTPPERNAKAPVQSPSQGSNERGGSPMPHRLEPRGVATSVRFALGDLRGSGNPLNGDLRTGLERNFGAPLADVRVHADGDADAATRAVDARAFAVGRNLYFSPGIYGAPGAEARHIVAHEVAHALQAAPGAARETAEVGMPDAPAERDAERAGGNVAVGVPASVHRRTERPAIRRFGSEEHRQLGEAAAAGRVTDINIGTDAAPRYLTFAEMVMMADYFATIEDTTALPADRMRTLAATQAGRDQLAWALWWMLDGSPVRGPEPAVSDATKQAVRDRYYRLAATNVTHFSAGGTASSTYEHYHSLALTQAFEAGRTGSASAWTAAQTTEAFGAHFLTDMFSAGHVRTPRASIRAWYAAHMPTSIDQFVTFMAQEMHASAVRRHPVADFFGQVPSVAALQTTIRSLGGSALNAFSLGDIVSLAMHNRDNQGLDVISDATPSGSMPISSHPWRAVGDNLLATSAVTRDMAVGALRFSIQELDQVHTAGTKAAGPLLPAAIAARQSAAMRAVTPFVALSLVPRVNTAAGPISMPYEWGSFNSETRGAVHRVVRGEIAQAIEDMANRQTDANRREVMLDFAALLRTRGIVALEDAVGTTAGGIAAPVPARVP